MVVDAEHHPALASAHKFGYPFVVLKTKLDPIPRHLPVRRVHIVEGMRPVITLGAFIPRQIFYINLSQAADRFSSIRSRLIDGAVVLLTSKPTCIHGGKIADLHYKGFVCGRDHFWSKPRNSARCTTCRCRCFFWMPTNHPFTTKRPASERVSLIQQEFGDKDWVLIGSYMDWGYELITHVDLIVFVVTATTVRLNRLAAREKKRFENRIAPGGDMHEIHVAFRGWASQCDNPNFSGRNRAWHEAWISEQTAPVLQIHGVNCAEKMAADVIDALS